VLVYHGVRKARRMLIGVPEAMLYRIPTLSLVFFSAVDCKVERKRIVSIVGSPLNALVGGQVLEDLHSSIFLCRTVSDPRGIKKTRMMLNSVKHLTFTRYRSVQVVLDT
jgi:hypothetical protein